MIQVVVSLYRGWSPAFPSHMWSSVTRLMSVKISNLPRGELLTGLFCCGKL